MSSSLFKKGLVVGIIILFLGLSMQSSIGTEILEEKDIEINVENEEDCKPCQLEELLKDKESIKDIKEPIPIDINELKNIFPFRCPYYLTRAYWSFVIGINLGMMYGVIRLPIIQSMMEMFFDRYLYYCKEYNDFNCPPNSFCGGD